MIRRVDIASREQLGILKATMYVPNARTKPNFVKRAKGIQRTAFM